MSCPEEAGTDETTLCGDPSLQEGEWDLMNEIISSQGKRQWEPEGIDEDLKADMIGERPDKSVTNEDCIAVVYNYVPDDE